MLSADLLKTRVRGDRIMPAFVEADATAWLWPGTSSRLSPTIPARSWAS